MKKIFTIACRVPGGFGEYVSFHSRVSLLDAELVLFSPFFGSFSSKEMFKGKPLLTETSSFFLRESVAHWRRELDTVLESGKNVFMLMAAPDEVYVSTGEKEYSGTGKSRTATNYVEALGNYALLPFSMEAFESRGGSMALHSSDNILRDYWRSFGHSSIYRAFIKTSSELEPLIETRHGNQIVGAMYQSKSGGALLLLPWVDFYRDEFFTHRGDEVAEAAEYERDFWGDYIDEDITWSPKAQAWGKNFIDSLVSLDATLRSRREVTTMPPWARDQQYRTTHEVVLSEQLQSVQSRISELESERSTVEEGLADAEYLKPLLYEQGRGLEQAVLAAMKLMGFKAESYRDSDSEFDVVLECTEGRCIGEVEGRDNKAIGIDKMRQLETNILEDLERDEVSNPAKGILFGNAFRLQPPSERPTEHFTPKCKTAAKRNGTALIRTCALFTVAKALADKPDGEYAALCRSAILSTGGEEVSFPVVQEGDSNEAPVEVWLAPIVRPRNVKK